MPNEFLGTLFGAAGSLVGAVLGVVGTAKLLTYRITQLEEKMKKQCENCTIMDGRVDRLEEKQAVMDEKIKVANHRIENLEKRG